MGRVIPFSEIETYITSLETPGACKGTILDTNILISASYEMRDSHAEVVDLWAYLQSKKYRLFATVNTRAVFLEFQRRLILTENLLDIVDAQSKVKLSSKAKAKIQTLKGSLMTSVVSDPEKDQVFNDSHLKKIKKEFSAGPNDPTQTELFDKTLGWPEAIGIDLPALDTLIFATPLSFEGRLIQYAGRIHRESIGKTSAQIIDFVDSYSPKFLKMYRGLVITYRKMGYQIHEDERLMGPLAMYGRQKSTYPAF